MTSSPSPSSQTKAPVLLIGPAHAGKSELAMRLLRPDESAIVIGTAHLREKTLADRVDRLKSLRPGPWESLDLVSDLPAVLNEAAAKTKQVMVDAVSQWLATLVVERGEEGESALEAHLATQVDELGRVIRKHPTCRFVLVSSEVGGSPAPSRAPERAYRKAVGLTHQKLAELAETVYWVAAGLPLKLKG